MPGRRPGLCFRGGRPAQAGERVEEVLPMRSAADLGAWGRLDDVIMGGRSSSGLAPAEGGVTWAGDLITDGGGFCGTRTQARAAQALWSRCCCEGPRCRCDGHALR